MAQLVPDKGTHRLLRGKITSKKSSEGIVMNVNEKALAKEMNLSVQTLRNWRHKGKGPPYIKIGRAVRYNIKDIEKYLKQNRIDPERRETK